MSVFVQVHTATGEVHTFIFAEEVFLCNSGTVVSTYPIFRDAVVDAC